MNSKIYNGNVQPNPKEFKIWVDDEGTIRTWNGTEWIEQSGGSGSDSGESGGSGSGSSSGDNNFKYYKFDAFPITETIYYYDETQYLITHMRAQLNADRYMYGSFAGVVRYFGKQSQNPSVDAFVFSPTSLFLGSEEGWVTIKSYEEAAELYPMALPPISYVTEITAEEYWQHYNVE